MATTYCWQTSPQVICRAFLLAAWLAGHTGGKDIMGLFWLSATSCTVLAVDGMGLAGAPHGKLGLCHSYWRPSLRPC